MIVIATHEGRQYIHNQLYSWHRYGTNGHTVVVVETGASSRDYLDYLRVLSTMDWSFPLKVLSTPYVGYDTGAYLHAYREYPAEQTMLFCHDSMEVKRPGTMTAFHSRLLNHGAGCVPWLVFRLNSYENEEQWNFVNQFEPDPSIHPKPGFGIFGPIFYTTRTTLQQLPFTQSGIYPTNKNQQEAMERGWAATFDRAGVPMVSLEGDFYENYALADTYSYFKKHLPKRQ